MRGLLFTCIVLTWVLTSLQGQTYIAKTQHFDVRDGLSDEQINSLAIDSAGILWIATNDGLNRFDGFEFKELNPLNSNLSSANIVKIYLVDNRKLYLFLRSSEARGQITDIQYLDLQTGIIQDDPEIRKKLGIPLRTGNLVEMDSSLLILDGKDKALLFPEGLQIKLPLEIARSRTFGLSHYLGVIANQDTVLIDVMSPETPAVFGAIPASTREFINAAVRKGIPIHSSSIFTDHIRGINWVEKGENLIGFNSQAASIQFVNNESSLTLPWTIRDLAFSEQIFVGTDGGLEVISLEKAAFRTYLKAQRRGNLSVRGIVEIDDTIYAATFDGVYMLPLGNNRKATKIFSDRAKALLRTPGGALLSGGKSVFKMRPRDMEPEMVYSGMDVPLGIWAMEFIDSNLILGAQGVIISLPYNFVTDEVEGEPVIFESNDMLGVSYQFLPYGNDQMLIVNGKGLFLSSHSLDSIEEIRLYSQNGDQAAFTHFTHIFRETSDTFWLSTLDGGIVQCQIKDGKGIVLRQLDRSSGLTTNTAYAVFPDEFGYLWVSTEDGILRVDKENWTYQWFTEVDGLSDREFNRVSYFRDAQGIIYFGGLHGITSLDPRDFLEIEKKEPSLRILKCEQFSSWENEIIDNTRQVTDTRAIRLGPNDNFFVLEVGLDDFFHSELHEFKYRIRSLDNVWTPMPGNTLRLHGLPYGHHEVEIEGKNARGVSASNRILLDLYVARPFYLQWWFYLLVLVGVFLAIRQYWLNRIQRAESQAKTLESLVESRTKTIAEQSATLERMQKARSQLFANISHELRTPLTLIKGPVESLKHAQNMPPDQVNEYINLITYNTNLLRERTDDLLTLSRADSGQLALNEENVDLHAFLEMLADSMSGFANENGMEINVGNSLPANTIIKTDRKKLQHVLSNFLSNAVKYGRSQTDIKLRCEGSGDMITFTVEDSGPGIPDDQLEQIFERFYQMGDSPGTGLGLALSKELAHVMHGKVWAASELGKGSAFYLAIPFVTVDADQPHTEEYIARHSDEPIISSFPSEAKSNGSILIVEDNRSMRTFLKNELAQYNTVDCGNGKEALERLDKLKAMSSLPDCIISDVMMPEMDGYELLSKLKAHNVYKRIPVVILTARADEENRMKALRIGVDDYMTKPFSAEELRIRIAHLTGRTATKQPESEDEKLPQDHTWLREVEEKLISNISDRHYTIQNLSLDLHISERQIYRRLKSLTGLTPNRYLREVRLAHARDLLEQGKVSTVASLSAEVGFSDPGYFSKLFEERWGYRPGERM